jgi:hypothetical protein
MLSSSPANATNEHTLSAPTETTRFRGVTKSWALFVVLSFLKETEQGYAIMKFLYVCVSLSIIEPVYRFLRNFM